MLFLSNMSLYELNQRKILLKSLKPKFWSNKAKIHSLEIELLKVESEINRVLSSEWTRRGGSSIFD